METLLGIPSEHTLEHNIKVANENDGIAEIINGVMHREAQRKDAVRGYGGVSALRDEMDAIKQLLEHIPL
jgi:hypothetical protein